MATKKKNVVTEVATAFGAAAARVESLKPKRVAAAKHTKATPSQVEKPAEIAVEIPVMSEREEVELVAYLYSEARGFQGGSQDEDWVRAEQEVRRRRSKKS